MPKEPSPIKINVADETSIKEKLKKRFIDPARTGKKKIRSEQVVGDDYHRDSGTWSKLHRIIDHDNKEYFEEIIDSTGKVIRRVREHLDQHQGHGSAKHKRERKPK
jgi:hypothetical protein